MGIEMVSHNTGLFESKGGDEFEAYIDPTAQGTTTTNTINTLQTYNLPNVLDSANVLKLYFYDDYTFKGAKQFYADAPNAALAYKPAYDSNYQAVNQYSKLTRGALTGTAVRILSSNNFLWSTLYYNDDGLPLQHQKDIINNGLNIQTNQYHFNGRLLSSHQLHTNPGSDIINFEILTKYDFG